MNSMTSAMSMQPGALPRPGGDVGTEPEGASLDIAKILTVLRSGLWWILGALVLSLVLGQFYVWKSTPIYQSDALVQVESANRDRTLNSALGDVGDAASAEKSQTSSEIEIIKSRMVLGRVAQAVGYDILARPRYFPVVGEAMARGHAQAAQPVVAPLGLNRYAWGGEHIQVDTLDVPPALVGRPLRLIAARGGAFNLYAGANRLLSGQVGTLVRKGVDPESRPGVAIFVRVMVARPGTEFDLIKLSAAQAVARVAGYLKVEERGRGTGMLGLTFESPEPSAAQQVLNRVVDTYQRQNVERRTADAEQTLAFLQQQLPQLKDKVEEAETSLKDFQVRQGSVNLPEETSQILSQEVILETQRRELLEKRQETLKRFTENHPQVRLLDDQLAALQGDLGNIEKRVHTLPQTQQALLSLKRDVEVNSALYTSLLNSYQELQISKAGAIGNARIIDYALVPTQPVRPRKTLIMGLAALAGLLAGLGIVFVRRLLYHGIEDPTVVESQLDLPTYAALPYVRSQARVSTRFRRTQGTLPILALLDPNNVAVEGLRSLRTSLHFAMLEAENNIIMLTGPSPGIGKSFISINLGAVLAMSGKSVVVVDADMRRGYLHEYIAKARTPGLSEYITGQADLETVLRPTPAASMMLVTTGELPPNPAELLLHPRFKALLEELSHRFDYVLVDPPPVLAVADAGVIGSMVGTTMLVLKAGEHELRTIEETVRRLRQSGSSVRGAIFNQMGRRGHTYSSRQGYYYGYQYDYGKSPKRAS